MFMLSDQIKKLERIESMGTCTDIPDRDVMRLMDSMYSTRWVATWWSTSPTTPHKGFPRCYFTMKSWLPKTARERVNLEQGSSAASGPEVCRCLPAYSDMVIKGGNFWVARQGSQVPIKVGGWKGREGYRKPMTRIVAPSDGQWS